MVSVYFMEFAVQTRTKRFRCAAIGPQDSRTIASLSSLGAPWQACRYLREPRSDRDRQKVNEGFGRRVESVAVRLATNRADEMRGQAAGEFIGGTPSRCKCRRRIMRPAQGAADQLKILTELMTPSAADVEFV